MNTPLPKTKISLFVILFFFSFLSQAGTIQQVKNGKVLIQFSGDTAQVGDQLFGISSEGKKTALLEVTAVKDNKGVAKVTKGTVKVNDTTQPRGSTPSKDAFAPAKIIRRDMKKIAVNFKFLMDSMSTKQQDKTQPEPLTENVDMKGNTFGINASLDYPLNDRFSLRGYAGYEMLKISGTSVRNNMCDNRTSRDCNVNISYLVAGGIARYNYNLPQAQVWAGVGASFKQPLTKKSTALNTENIQIANSILVATGLDYHINNLYFMPISIEYHKSFNESETVPKIQEIAISVGFGKLF